MNTDAFYEMFESNEKKTSEARTKNNSSQPEEFLKMKIGGVYTFRLLPQTMIDFDEVGFKSRSDSSYQYLGLSPSSVYLGDAKLKKDLIKNTQWESYNQDKDSPDPAIKKRSMQLIPKVKKLAGIYLISDSLVPENNNKLKILNFGAGFNNKTKEPMGNIWKRLHPALLGDKKDRYGKKLFDLGEKGVTIEITVGKKMIGSQEIPEYTVEFLTGDPIPGMNDKKIKEVLGGLLDLDAFVPELKSQEDIKHVLDQHWNCKDTDDDELDVLDNVSENNTPVTAWAEGDDIDFS